MNPTTRYMRIAAGVAITAAFMSATLAVAAAPAPIVSIVDGESAAQRAIVDPRPMPHRTPTDSAAVATPLAGSERAARCAIVVAECPPRPRGSADDSALHGVAITDGEQAAERAIAAPVLYRRTASGAVARAASAR